MQFSQTVVILIIFGLFLGNATGIYKGSSTWM